VTSEPGIRFYAGHPVRSPEGGRVAVLSLIDRRPRLLNPADLNTLRDLALLVENELKMTRLSQAQRQLTVESALLRQQAVLDSLTQIWNRRGILDLLRRELAEAERQGTPLGTLMVEVDHFEGIDNTFGQGSGQEVLRVLAQRLRAAVRPYDAVGRYEGEAFLIVLPRLDPAGAEGVAKRIRASMEESPVEITLGKIPVTLSMGGTAYPGTGAMEGNTLVETSEAALGMVKSEGGNGIRIAPPPPTGKRQSRRKGPQQ
jgi:diguanylate cyclase (GGDEF)-like protein